ncbi:MAG: cob(I)yrinic acid a,c-diamide adenosyltransferase [Proteobacteria bacterium]|nr:cob(I)yrinic acid a,c-diamide adenosyltransferase [Pseudomonadota bacterium]
MSIATKKGDSGTTKLLFGKAVDKCDNRVEAYGEIDELNAHLGVCRAYEHNEIRKSWLLRIQEYNFVLGAELATPPEDLQKLKQKIASDHLSYIDDKIIELEEIEGLVDGWNIPGKKKLEAHYDVARSVCRRAERKIVLLGSQDLIKNNFVAPYINRLSDLLWLMLRQSLLD